MSPDPLTRARSSLGAMFAVKWRQKNVFCDVQTLVECDLAVAPSQSKAIQIAKNISYLYMPKVPTLVYIFIPKWPKNCPTKNGFSLSGVCSPPRKVSSSTSRPVAFISEVKIEVARAQSGEIDAANIRSRSHLSPYWIRPLTRVTSALCARC